MKWYNLPNSSFWGRSNTNVWPFSSQCGAVHYADVFHFVCGSWVNDRVLNKSWSHQPSDPPDTCKFSIFYSLLVVTEMLHGGDWKCEFTFVPMYCYMRQHIVNVGSIISKIWCDCRKMYGFDYSRQQGISPLIYQDMLILWI